MSLLDKSQRCPPTKESFRESEQFPTTAKVKGLWHERPENVDLGEANEPAFKSYWDLSEDHEKEYNQLLARRVGA
jgi:hypothetical protein